MALGMTLVLSVARAEITREQRAQVAALKTAIDQAARLFKQEKFSESAVEVAKCQAMLAAAAVDANAEMLAALKPAAARLKKAGGLFAAKGIPLPELPQLSAAAGATAQSPPVAAPPQESAAPTSRTEGEVSFAKDVAPILVTRCGGCHVGRNMGQFSMATFASLMQGSENGAMIEAGNPDESVLVMLVEAGDMPPPRPRPRPVPKNEVQVLREWVAQGAKFDGANDEQPVLEMVPPEIARAAAGRGGRGPRRGAAGASRPAR
jgi:hypothetical protein